MKISFVIPCYRSEHTIMGVVDELKATIFPWVEKIGFPGNAILHFGVAFVLGTLIHQLINTLMKGML